MKIRKATDEEKRVYLANPMNVYPLYGFGVSGGVTFAIEDLQGDPDVKYEAMAPVGFIWGDEVHTLLCDSLKDLRERVRCYPLRQCCCPDCHGF